MEKFTFFWKKSIFSQWSRSNFTVTGVSYTHAEQWMMAEKARLFEDDETLKKIMKADHPREQKDLGREVKNFNKDKWNKVAREVVFVGNMAKFTQNKDMQEILLATEGTTIVEASPGDCIWGIGLDMKDPRCNDRTQWRGTNWLGEVLTNVRDELLKKEGH